MSFILDALRKVDAEKRASSDSAPPLVAIDRLNKERFRRRRDVVVMAVVGVLSAVTTAFLLRRSAEPEPLEPEAQMVEEAAPVASVPAAPDPPDPEESVEIPPDATSAPSASPTRDPAPALPPVEMLPAEPIAAVEPEIAAPVRVVGQESPSRSISTPVRETPVATDPGELPKELSWLVLQGTSVLDGKPVAVVSDRRVFEGDQIEGATVIRIGERSVELEFQGRRFTLTL